MTKKELVELLAEWPDDAAVEIAILNATNTDYTWYEIVNVEEPTADKTYNKHCLIYPGNATMF